MIILAEVWKTTPFMALLLLAGLTTIDEGLYEAANVDGASAWQRFWRITLPLMKPAILVALLFRTLDAFRVFDSIFVMTRGAQDTESVSILGYNQLIARLNLGLGSAVSVLIFSACLIIAFVFVKGFGVRMAEGRPVADGDDGAREYTLWSIGITVVLFFALIPVLWIVSLSLKTPATIGDERFIPQDIDLRQLHDAVRRRDRREPVHRAADQLDRHRAHRDDRSRSCSRRSPPTRSRAWNFPGKALILAGALAIAMFPPISTVGPLFDMWRSLGLYDT